MTLPVELDLVNLLRAFHENDEKVARKGLCQIWSILLLDNSDAPEGTPAPARVDQETSNVLNEGAKRQQERVAVKEFFQKLSEYLRNVPEETHQSMALMLVDTLWLFLHQHTPPLAPPTSAKPPATNKGAKKNTPTSPESEADPSAKVDDVRYYWRDSLVNLIQQHAALKRAVWESMDTDWIQFLTTPSTDDASSNKATINTTAELQKKMRLTNTQFYYRQTKFNLLAEDVTGFGQLWVHLVMPATTTTTSTAQWIERFASIMGIYQLDPNRCLDMVLQILYHDHEQHPEQSQQGVERSEGPLQWPPSSRPARLLSLLKHSSPLLLPVNKIAVLVGFHLQQLEGQGTTSSKDGGSADAGSNNNTSTSGSAIFSCVTELVLLNLVSVDEVMPFLPPWMDDLNCTFQAWHQQEQKRVQSLGRVRLSTPSSTGAAAEEAGAAAVDQRVESLRKSWVIQWIEVFCRWRRWHAIQPYLSVEQWSQLATLFPESIGVSICHGLEHRLEEWTALASSHSGAPWHQMNSEKTIRSSSSIPAASKMLLVLSQHLACVQESGCLVLLPALYAKLCRVLRHILSDATLSQDERTELYRLTEQVALPHLSIFPCQAAFSLQLWHLMQMLPYTVRYRMYRAWRDLTKKPLWRIEGDIAAGKEARYILKRLSKDTIRDISRSIAKVCNSYPLVVFTTILNQIESYDNLVQVMVDALRFATPLSLDILGFCILSRLSGQPSAVGGADFVNRSRLKDDGVNVSQWLQSLESFTGAFYKRFPLVEVQGILSYLMHRLKDGQVMELGVLRTLLKTAGGWAFADYAPAASLTTSQLEGRGGSTLLKRETMSFGVVEDFNYYASKELRRVLQNQDMGVILLILLAQVRFHIIFADSEQRSSTRQKPVKLIGNLYDTCQVIMAMLLDFLTEAGEGSSPKSEALQLAATEKYASSLPTLLELQQVYKLDVASSWMLCRPLVRWTVESRGGTRSSVEPFVKFAPTEGMREAYKSMLPEPSWTVITPIIFETFYTKTLYDLFCPENVYATEISRLEREMERLSRTKPSLDPAIQPGAPPSKSDDEELQRVKRAVTGLASDLSKHVAHVAAVRAFLVEHKDEFFCSNVVSQTASSTLFVNCIFPRCMQGPDDAMYCARFVSLLHELETPGFSTFLFFDCLIVALSRALFGLTEGEAANASILLFETWKQVSRWRYDEAAFEQEVVGKPGSFVSDRSSESTADGASSISRQEYEGLYNKWHAALGATAMGCLESSEYMHRRNALIVLTRMVEAFPTRPRLANKLLKALEPLQEESNSFADIRASAQAYSTQLMKARDEGVWKEEDAATVKARVEKGQAAAAARQKKAKEQMEQMKRDSEKITETIGDWDGRRSDRRRPVPGDRPEPPTDLRRSGSVGALSKPFEPAGREATGRVSEPEARDERRRQGSSSQTAPSTSNARESSREERWARDRAPAPGSKNSHSATVSPVPPSATIVSTSAGSAATQRGPDARSGRGNGEEGPPTRGLEGRWQLAASGDNSGRGGGDASIRPQGVSGSKRSRPPSPEDQGEVREEPSSRAKRARTESNTDEGPRSDDGGRRSEEGGFGGSARKLRKRKDRR